MAEPEPEILVYARRIHAIYGSFVREGEANPQPEKSLRDQAAQLRDKLNALLADPRGKTAEKLLGPAPATSQLDTFLESVAKSVIRAQEVLNTQSLEYVDALDARVEPSHYSIPNVKGELKVGFREHDSERVGLVFFSEKEERERYGESTISFELQASPPPPSDQRSPPPFLVFGALEQAVLVEIEAHGGAEFLRADENFVRGRSHALVLRDRDSERSSFLVVWPARTGDSSEKGWVEVAVFFYGNPDPARSFRAPVGNQRSYRDNYFFRVPLGGDLHLPAWTLVHACILVGR